MQKVKNIDRLLHINGKYQWGAYKNSVYKSLDGGLTWHFFSKLKSSTLSSIVSKFRLFARLLRLQIDYLIPIDNKVVVFAYKKIYVFDENAKEVNESPIVGSKPLSVCCSDGKLYYGEYCSNRERKEIRIFCSENSGIDWEVAWEFSSVRHVHGVFVDPYDNSIWVTTGDSNDEAAIWRTDDGFKTLDKILTGSQQVRAVHLLFDEQFVYYGSDAPAEENYIYRMCKSTFEIQKLTEVGNSVFFACKVGDNLFFSTAVEPSEVNLSKHSEIWHSRTGQDWSKVCSFKKDRLSMKYFQYGQISFPNGNGDNENLWFTPNALKYDNCTFRIPINSL